MRFFDVDSPDSIKPAPMTAILRDSHIPTPACDCGEPLDQDCYGRDRCPICDGPCPGCGQ